MPDGPAFLPQARKPVKYKKPGGGLVTLLVVGFAVLGSLGVAVIVLKKMDVFGQAAGLASKVAAPAPAKPVTYRALEMDDAVLITVEVKPKGVSAQLMLDGVPMPSNPARIPRGGAHKVTAMAEGYAPMVEEFQSDAAKTVRVTLKKTR